MPARDITLLFVRLPTAEKRRIKVLAASQGLTLQQAVHEAFEAWASQLAREGAPPLDARPIPPGSADLEKPRPPSRAATAEPTRRRPAAGDSSLTPRRSQPQNLEGAALEWFRRAGALDWSKCPAVESVPREIGNVWVVRGTGVPVAAIFRRLAEGQRFGEVAQAIGLTGDQLKPVLQFAAESGMFRAFEQRTCSN